MEYAITLFGRDSPGIIAALTSYLKEKDINVEDASMTILQGHFAMILVMDIADHDPDVLCREIAEIEELADLKVSISDEIEKTEMDDSDEPLYILHLTSNDSIGIVSEVTRILKNFDANIIDCSTRKNQTYDLFTLVLDAIVPSSKENQLVEALEQHKEIIDGDLVFRRVDETDL